MLRFEHTGMGHGASQQNWQPMSAWGQKHALPQCNGKGRFTPISGLRPLWDHPKRVASLHSTPESLLALNTGKPARGLGGNPELPNILQNAPHRRLRGAAHSSICIQEGQPYSTATARETRPSNETVPAVSIAGPSQNIPPDARVQSSCQRVASTRAWLRDSDRVYQDP